MTIIDNLLILQERDCAIKSIIRELKDIPARQKDEELRLKEHQEYVEQAEQALKSKQAAIKDVELEIEASRQKIIKFRQQQLDIKTNKEFKAIEDEVASVGAFIAQLEEKQLVIMEDLEAASADLNGKKKALSEEENSVQSDKQVLGERAARLQSELKQLEEVRAIAAKEIDSGWLERYNQLVERKDKALVPVENSVCSGCHMTLPPAVVHEAGKRSVMVFCDHCGRLLY